MESRRTHPMAPSETISREQANRICSNVRAFVKELVERDHSFSLRWDADMRAIERWRAEDPKPRDLLWPDHADLCVWLMKQLEKPLSGYTRDHLRRVELAAAQGAYEALTTNDHLGIAVRRHSRIKPRTLEGDTFEHVFEWARDHKKDLEEDEGPSHKTIDCDMGAHCPCYISGYDHGHDDGFDTGTPPRSALESSFDG